jgi:hypothetical protein
VQKMTFDSYLYKTVVPGARVCWRVRVCACVRACACACVRARARVCWRAALTQHALPRARACVVVARGCGLWVAGWGLLCSCRGRHAHTHTCTHAHPHTCTPTPTHTNTHNRTHTTPGNPLDDAKLLFNTVASIVRANALRSNSSKSVDVSFGSKATEEFQARVAA